MCSASSITATPRGFKTSSIAVTTCEVRCSCVCRRRAKTSIKRGILERPTTRSTGKWRRAPSRKRHHVVFAMRVKRDVANEHKVIVAAGLGERTVEHVGWAFTIPPIEFFVGCNDSLWRIEQAFPIGIITRKSNQRPHRGCRLLL